jgi:hypothetical protein
MSGGLTYIRLYGLQSVRPVVPLVRLHYRQQCTSARLSIRLPESPNCPSSVLSDPKPKLTPTTKLLMPS